MADREFVGEKWIGYLNQQRIRYHIRIRNNFWILLPGQQKKVKAYWLFNDLKIGQYKHYDKIVSINGVLCYISGCKLRGGEFLIIISFNKPHQAQKDYKQKWQSEMCFKAMKSSGFDIEKTHLTDPERIEKLVLLIIIAFIWCYKVGIHLHQNVKKIQIKKHGRKAKSIFKHGLDFVANVLLNPLNQSDIDIIRFLSYT